MKKDINTEEKILLAARKIFIQKGMDGARMQEISDEAGINKALLHYYFRNKNKLFEAVFTDIFKTFFGKVGSGLMSDAPIKEKIMLFTDTYIDTIAANPFVPQFIINEINRDPSIMQNIMNNAGFQPDMLVSLFESQIKHTEYDIRHFIVSILGLCIFPFAARPLMETIYFDSNKGAYEKFLQERKAFVSALLLKFIDEN